MSGKHTAALAAVALALLAAWFVWLKSVPGTSARLADAALLCPGLDTSSVTRLRISDVEGTPIELERSPGGWNVVAPIRDTADPEVVASILRTLAEARVVARVPRDGVAGGPEATGLDDRAPRIGFGSAGRMDVITLGRPSAGGLRFAATSPDEPLALVDAGLADAVVRPLDDLRQHALFHFAAADVGRWRIESRGHPPIVLERREGSWWMAAPFAEAADESLVSGALTRVLELRAEHFEDAAEWRDPALTLRFFGADGTALATLALGPPRDAAGRRRAVLDGRDAVFDVAFSGLLAELARDANAFRARGR